MVLLNFLICLGSVIFFVCLAHVRKPSIPIFFSFVSWIFIITAGYATFRTNGYSLYMLAFILSICFWVFTPGKFFLCRKDILLHIWFSILATIIFWLIWIGFDVTQKAAFIDYTFYERIARYNDIFKTENTGGILNRIGFDMPRNEFYHYFEGWLMSALHHVNGLSRGVNFFGVVFPLFVVSFYLGVKHLSLIAGITLSKTGEWLLLPLLLIGSLFFTSPYEVVRVYLLELMPSLPATSYSSLINMPKMLLVFPVAIAMMDLVINDWHWAKGCWMLLFMLIYPSVLPVVAIVFCFFILLKCWRKEGVKYVIASGVILVAWVLILYIAIHKKDQVAPRDLSTIRFFAINNWAKSFLLWIFLPLIGLGWLWFTIKKIFKEKSHLLFIWILVTLFTGWIITSIMYEVLDSHQIFVNFILPCIVTLIVISMLWLLQKKPLLVLSLLLVLISFSYKSYQFIPKANKVPPEIVKFINHNKKEISILSFPDSTFMGSHFRYNDKYYFPFSELTWLDPDIHMMGVTGAMPVNPSFKEQDIRLVNVQRKQSKLYQECGELNASDLNCFIAFARKNGFEYIIAMQPLNDKGLETLYTGIYGSLYRIRQTEIFN